LGGLHPAEHVQRFLADAKTGGSGVLPWLELDSGMHRLGLSDAAFSEAKQALAPIFSGRSMTVMTHFACADTPAHVLHEAQCARLAGLQGLRRSACNSAALLAGGVRDDDIVRPGIMLYGGASLADLAPAALGLQPVMTLTSRILAVRTVPVGESVGYGAAWTAQRVSRIATVALGYGDGYPRTMPAGSPVLTAAGRATLVGRVSMDSLAIDVTDLPSVTLGQEVVLWGEGLAVDELAERQGTIGYELLTRLGPRVPRVLGGRPRG
jgi:alanine racemase